MRKYNIFLGLLLLALGVVFLGYNYHWFSINLSSISKAWPLLVVLAGVSVLLNKERKFLNSASVILLALAIPMAIYNGANRGVTKFKNELDGKIRINGETFNFDEDTEEQDYVEEDLESPLDKYAPTDGRTYQLELLPEIKKGKLEIKGGAAKFTLGDANSGNLFSAETDFKNGNFKLSEGTEGDTHSINFEMDDYKSDIRGDDENVDNKVKLFLSKKVAWDIDLGIGAGLLNYDLSDYEVEHLDINSGAASINVKLGDLSSNTKVEVNSGAASVKLELPENVGARIELDGLLNSKDFNGFRKINSRTYETDNYDSAANKVDIDVNSAFSSLKVLRY